MKRKDSLAWLRIAGYHNNTAAFVRLYVENRVSRTAADKAWDQGVKYKKDGGTCSCRECKAK